jgi:ankyrin repeat protein
MEELKSRNEKVINDEDEFSNSGLHKAAENGHLEAIKLLTQWGAAKDAR